MANVSDILTTEAFRNALVLAGQSGLSNTVKTVTVAEVPDAAHWLRGQEIVCTTGFFIRESSASQVSWIESLIAHGAAALAIKTTRFLGEIPQAIVNLANQKHFPIISLPPDSTWPFVIESIMNLITDEQVAKLRRAQEIHDHLTKLVLEGKSVQSITQTLSDLVKNPVIVEDGRFNILASSIPSTEVLNHNAVQPDEIQHLLYYRLNSAFQEKLLHSDYYKRILRGRTNERLELPLDHGSARSITIPILASNIVYGFLSIVAVSGEYSPIDMVAMEQGGITIALQLVRGIMNEEAQRAETDRVIESLIRGRIHTSSLKQHLPSKIDWATPMVALCVEGQFDKVDQELYVAENPQKLLENFLQRGLETSFGTCIVGHYDGRLTALVPFKADNLKQLSPKLESVLQHLFTRLNNKHSLKDIRIGVGGIYVSPNKLQKSYDDALQVLKVLKLVPTLGPIQFYEKIAVYRIISMIDDHEELHSFCYEMIEPLLKHDQQHDDALCETLQVYLLQNGNVTATAKQLYVHPNTVSYRIKKIQNFVGDVINDPEYRLALAFSLLGYKYTNVK